jgi:predicted glycosyltransferase involved in capsule biosynthesis
MIEDKDITFICHLRIDNESRIKNVKTIYKYYKKYLPNCRFVFVEDDAETKLLDFTFIDSRDEYTLVYNNDLVKKCAGYNHGAKYSDTDILIFLDVDIIVDCNKLLECINDARDNDSLECLIGYNGCAFYMTQQGEKQFLNTLNVEDLYSRIKNLHLVTNNANEFALLGNTKAVGGCLIMTKKSFNQINGFNPFFIGWGYEDNEIICRAHRLGLNVTKSNIVDHFLYHLPHSDPTKDKSHHNHYAQNKSIYELINSLEKHHILNYIKQW